jgi:hypothetical protein
MLNGSMTVRELIALADALDAGSLVPPQERSAHYLAYIGSQRCVVSALTDQPQRSRTTIHHIHKPGMALRCADFWTIPVAEDLHVLGKQSIDRLGKQHFLQHHGLPGYEEMALVYLMYYLAEAVCNEPLYSEYHNRIIMPRPVDRVSGIHYAKGLADRCRIVLQEN